MKNILFKVILFSVVIMSASCEDFIENDLEGKSVQIFIPLNNTVTSNYTQSFWWAELNGATRYKLQIVRPDFSLPQQLVVDTLVGGTQFSYTLQPGAYQWRIRGENSSSIGEYSVFNLTVDSSLNLSSQTLLLNTPADNLYSNSMIHSFSWYAMPNANNYVFGIYTNSGVQVGNTQSLTATSASYTFTAEGTYRWRVFAQNSQSASPYSERIITIDTTAPSIPVLTYSPLGDTTSLSSIPLSWNQVEANALYTLRISTDSTFVSYTDTVTSASSYNFYNSVIGVYYYWKVAAADQSGNSSVFSSKKRIKRL
ncbi:MAG: hypothetical protein L6Q66_06545 [Bacteroidia bacterium]|nr:hypothetical protein [Bacteroidia bacterium]